MIWKLWIPPSAIFVISTHERIKGTSLFGFWPWKHNPQLLSSPKAFPAVNSSSESPRQLLELRINLLWGEDLRDTDGWITGVQLSDRPYLAQFNMGSNLFQRQGSKAVTLCPGEAGRFWLGAICNPITRSIACFWFWEAVTTWASHWLYLYPGSHFSL